MHRGGGKEGNGGSRRGDRVPERKGISAEPQPPKKRKQRSGESNAFAKSVTTEPGLRGKNCGLCFSKNATSRR